MERWRQHPRAQHYPLPGSIALAVRRQLDQAVVSGQLVGSERADHLSPIAIEVRIAEPVAPAPGAVQERKKGHPLPHRLDQHQSRATPVARLQQDRRAGLDTRHHAVPVAAGQAVPTPDVGGRVGFKLHHRMAHAGCGELEREQHVHGVTPPCPPLGGGGRSGGQDRRQQRFQGCAPVLPRHVRLAGDDDQAAASLFHECPQEREL